MRNHRTARFLPSVLIRVVIATLIPVGLFAGISAADTTPAVVAVPYALTAPTGIPGVAALPFTGVTSTAFTLPATMGNLVVTPDQGVTGTPMAITGSGLPASSSIQLTWSTDSATWLADVEPNTVNYMGTSYSKFTVNMVTVTTSATGTFSFKTTAPADFGGVHDIYAVQNGVALAHGGFELLRILSVTPRSGPIGTPITITYTSMGASLYTGGAEVLWDNHYTGEMQANWTRGTASVTIRAAGPIGTHFIQVGNAISFMYLNVIQSPIPYTNGGMIKFKVTKDNGPPKAFITWPATLAPTDSQVTTMSTAGLDPASNAVASLSVSRGPVDSPTTLTVTGLPTNGPATLVWSTVVGNRVNCASTCWSFSSVPLGSATVTNGSIDQKITVPDGLGGYHVVQVMDGSTIEAQVPFYVKESIVPFFNKAGHVISMGLATANDSDTVTAIAAGQSGVGSHTFKDGQEFTISIKGVGWTQLDNTLGVDYDNSYIGYSCGFNSNGYMVVHLKAIGAPGTHLIDLYPMLYSLSPSFPSTPYGMVPMLSANRDYPGLALGYQVPSIHFAITIVK
ncbi:MAG: hypothetical protein WCF25_10165 [Acidimicrobiales bacterium]